MKRDPMAGAWIVEAAIIALLMLLIGRKFGIAITFWTAGISLIAGLAIISAIRTPWRSRNSHNR